MILLIMTMSSDSTTKTTITALSPLTLSLNATDAVMRIPVIKITLTMII